MSLESCRSLLKANSRLFGAVRCVSEGKILKINNPCVHERIEMKFN